MTAGTWQRLLSAGEAGKNPPAKWDPSGSN